jgi:hypothetical protein
VDPLLGTVADFDHLVKDVAAHQIWVIVDLVVRDLAAARREPAVHRIEPEQKSEPELRRATPPGQLLQLITGQRPVPDQLIIIQHTRHETSGSPASTAATTHRKPNESGSILAAHDQRVQCYVCQTLPSRAIFESS